jgi:hypothetical protein
MSLAVVVCDTLLQTSLIRPSLIRPGSTRRDRYPLMIETVNDAHFDDELLDLALALRPVVSFLAEWRPSDHSKPKPKRLSRHLSVHGASPEHFSEGNATLAVMLATSLLIGLSEGENLIDANSSAQ